GQPGLLKRGYRLVPSNPDWGSMTLAAIDAKSRALVSWSRNEELAAFADGASGRRDEVVAKAGETVNGALAVPFSLAPGESRTVTFVVSWYFPNFRFEENTGSRWPIGAYRPDPPYSHAVNLYARRWSDAADVARYVAGHLDNLWEWTRLYHDTMYQSNLPEEFIDAMTSQSVIMRSPTCFWTADGYFGGYEGSPALWPLNCAHVWNYAQTHARLFPELGRNMRISDLVTFRYPDGEIPHRQMSPRDPLTPANWIRAYADGQCAGIVAAWREHQLSPDRLFLERVWPGVKKAMEWMIATYDSDLDGVTGGRQWNTYDTAVGGPNTFIGSQYLCALAAAERMAMRMDDAASAQRWRTIREAGMKNQNERLWNGEYYIEIPGPTPADDYNTGCFSDQLLGQWWADMLDLDHLYPPERVRSALQAILKYNFQTNGLQNCTWPKNDRPDRVIYYHAHKWPGVEYAVAASMVYEGLIEDARQVVKAVRGRYAGDKENPFSEPESGGFYVRSMSSWGLLIAAQGLILDGPAGVLGFKPRWQKENHRSFFTAPEGWGLFVQKCDAREQSERIELRYGRLRLKELVFEVPNLAAAPAVTVSLDGRRVRACATAKGDELRIVLAREHRMSAGAVLDVAIDR
ncbi:MAG: GH116 family glycosyl hydrolase, partial [Kiritimatiellae bacterium]|nr:GH116 family glycosyl hydrolase [Kiritimatiellia bacterium]